MEINFQKKELIGYLNYKEKFFKWSRDGNLVILNLDWRSLMF